jgi:hypothetical protein
MMCYYYILLYSNKSLSDIAFKSEYYLPSFLELLKNAKQFRYYNKRRTRN